MAWRIEVDKDVQRSMRKLDKQIAKRIVAKLHEISQLEDPRSMGKGLTEKKVWSMALQGRRLSDSCRYRGRCSRHSCCRFRPPKQGLQDSQVGWSTPLTQRGGFLTLPVFTLANRGGRRRARRLDVGRTPAAPFSAAPWREHGRSARPICCSNTNSNRRGHR